MAVIPSSAHFNYVQNQTPINIDVAVDTVPEWSEITNLQLLNMPPWLTAENLIFDGINNQVRFRLKVNVIYAFNMNEGLYNQNIQLRLRARIPGSFTPVNITFENYLTSIEVTHNTILTINPTNLNFGTYVIGNPNPQNKTLSIQTSQSWTAEAFQSWVTLSSISGVQNGQISVGVDPSGLSVGQYQTVVQVSDSLSPNRQAIVTLNVSEGDTESTYLYINPQNFQFISELGVENTTQKNINIEASASWTATASETWIVLSAASGTSGISNITLSVDSVLLTDTSVPYLATITFNIAGIQKVAYVQLVLVEFLIQGINSETLYFSDDRNKLAVTNVFENMFLQLQAIASNGSSNVPYTLEAPYQNGIAKVLIGMEANVLLKSVLPPSQFLSRVSNNIAPININFTAYNKNKTNNATSVIDSFTNVKFLTGRKPAINNKLCYIPQEISMSKKGVVSISVLAQSSVASVAQPIYNEELQEIGGEWDVSTDGNVESDSTDFASSGTKSIKYSLLSALGNVQLSKSAPVVLLNAVLSLDFKQPTVHDYKFFIQLSNTLTAVTYPLIYVEGNNFGLDPNSTEFQTIAIPIVNVTSLDRIRIFNLKDDSVIYLDKIEIVNTSTVVSLDSSDIVITGDADTTITTGIVENLYVYNAMLNLSDLALSSGDRINMAFAGIDVDINITDTPPNSTMLAFESEWKEYELFECRGFLTELAEASKTTTELQIEGQKHTKVVSIDFGKQYTINTGYIFSKAEVEWLANILNSKRIFMYFNNERIEIVLDTKNLELFKTREYNRSYNLKFTKAIV